MLSVFGIIELQVSKKKLSALVICGLIKLENFTKQIAPSQYADDESNEIV